MSVAAHMTVTTVPQVLWTQKKMTPRLRRAMRHHHLRHPLQHLNPIVHLR